MHVKQAGDEWFCGKRGVIYMRVSSPGQEQNYSLPEQERDATRCARELGILVADGHVIDDGWQRSYTLNRPGIGRIRELFRTKQVDVLIVARYDRLSRSQLQQGALLYEIEQVCGGKVISAHPTERFEDSAEGRLLRNVFAFKAEKEREDIAWRTQGGRRARAREGKLIPCHRPLYGYLWADPEVKHGKTRYVPDPRTAPVVRRVFQEAMAGVSPRRIARGLMGDGVPSPSHQLAGNPGGNWHGTVICKMLRNPAYMGAYVSYRYKREWRVKRDVLGRERDVSSAKLRPVDDPDRQVLGEDACPALVTRAVFAAANGRVDRNKAEATRNNRHPASAILRSGIAVCGYCGKNLQVHYRRGIAYYRCDFNDWAIVKHPEGGPCITVAGLDGAAMFFLCHLFSNPRLVREAVVRLQDAYGPEIERVQTGLEYVTGRLAELEAEAGELMELAQRVTHRVAKADLAQRIDAIYLERDRLLQDRQTRSQQAARWGDIEAQMATYERWSAAMARELHQASYQWKRTAFAMLGLTVKVWLRGHEPRYQIECNLGGLETVFAADDREVAWLRRDDCDAGKW